MITDIIKVVFDLLFCFKNNGVFNVIPASLAPTLTLKDFLSLFPSLCSKAKTPERGLSYSAPKDEVDKVTSLIKSIFSIPTGPPALPWVLKWLMFGISTPSR